MRSECPTSINRVYRLGFKPASPQPAEKVVLKLREQTGGPLPTIQVITTSKELALAWQKLLPIKQYALAAAIWSQMNLGNMMQPLVIEHSHRTWLATKVDGEEEVVIHIS